MNECDEIGDSLWNALYDRRPIRSLNAARRVVRGSLPEAEPVITDNVAARLLKRAQEARIEVDHAF